MASAGGEDRRGPCIETTRALNISVVVVDFSEACLNENGIVIELVFEAIPVGTVSSFRKTTGRTADDVRPRLYRSFKSFDASHPPYCHSSPSRIVTSYNVLSYVYHTSLNP